MCGFDHSCFWVSLVLTDVLWLSFLAEISYGMEVRCLKSTLNLPRNDLKIETYGISPEKSVWFKSSELKKKKEKFGKKLAKVITKSDGFSVWRNVFLQSFIIIRSAHLKLANNVLHHTLGGLVPRLLVWASSGPCLAPDLLSPHYSPLSPSRHSTRSDRRLHH